MFEVDANGFSCEFENGNDAINAFLMCVYMINDSIDVRKLSDEVKYALQHTRYNQYEYKNSVSIRQIH